MIVATAGHIDHGKTALIRALTQVDTDRLEEEKRRGLSIDLGFAYADFGGALPLGFIDVPGHERFIRNMLAGVAAIDYALLVIAVDDGPMPQTHEHLAILDLLGISRGAIALTKIDRVPSSRVATVKTEIQALLARTSLAAAPQFPLSSITGEGLPELRDELARAVRDHRNPAPKGFFRLTVDRGFSVKGAGWVVTGTVLDGTVQVGDAVTVSPQGLTARVRAVHVHNSPASVAHAGERCALNLAGDLKQHPIGRGTWLLASVLHQPTDRIDVSLRLLAAETRPLGHGAPVQLHLGAAVRNGRIALLARPALAPGESGLAQLVLDAPVHAVCGDRFILRDPAAQRTLAGGRVLDPFGPRRGRGKPSRQAVLAAIARQGGAQSALAALLEASSEGVALERFVQAFNITPDTLGQILSAEDVETFVTPFGPLGLKRSQVEALSLRLLNHLDAWHVHNPESLGLAESEMTLPTGPRLTPEIRHVLIARLLGEGALVRTGFSLHRPGHQPRISDADRQRLDAITDILEESGLRPPIVGELAERLGLAKADLLGFLERAHGLGYLVRVAPNRYFLPSTVSALTQIAVSLAEASATGTFDAARFRDRSGIGRNLSIQVLEYLDRAGVTRFVNEQRFLK